MSTMNCFDEPKLKDYLLGRLPDDESDVIAAHVDACPDCEATISGLDGANDTLTSGLKRNAAEPFVPAPIADSQAAIRPAVRVPSDSLMVAKQPQSEAFSPDVLRDYRLMEQLGAGGMGTVFRAVHTRLDRLVAVKLLPARRLGDPLAVARFQREMRVIGQLSHPAIVQATDAGEVDGTHFLVMEYVDGMDLNRVARWCGPLSVADACEIARQAAVGLEYAHQQGVVHRDVKPSNVMLSVLLNRSIDGASRPDVVSVKLLDLGLALLSGVQAAVDELTTVGQLMGTLDYMAPEQFEDSHFVDARADIYSLAATVYRLLSGEPPYGTHQHKSPLQKLKILATAEPMPLCQRRADVPAELGMAIDRALSRESADRFQSMSDFAASLAPWVKGHDLAALWQRASHAESAALAAIESLERSACSAPSFESAHSQDRASRAAERGPLSAAHQPSLSDAQSRRTDSQRSVASLQETAPNAVHSQSSQPSQPSKRGQRAMWALLATVLCGVLAVVITITTNNGVLVVESMKDGIEVRLKKSGRVVKQFEVTHGTTSTRVAAGEYELELVGKTDGLNVEGGTFTLIRGGSAVARIVERPLEAAGVAPAASNVARPTQYDDPVPFAGSGAMPIGLTPDMTDLDVQKPVAKSSKQPPQLLDLKAKGMDSFDATNAEVARERKVRDVLTNLIDAEFNEIPLEAAVDELSERIGVPCFLDQAAIKDETDVAALKVTLSMKEAPVAAVLNVLTRSLNLTWTIDDQRIAFTTPHGRLFQKLTTRFYPIGRIRPGMQHTLDQMLAKNQAAQKNGGFFGGGGGGMFSIPATERRLVLNQFGGGGGGAPQVPEPTLVTPFFDLFGCLDTQWAMDGQGEGSINLLGNVLVVRQTKHAHWQIEELLRQLEVAFAAPNRDRRPITLGDFAETQNRAVEEKLKHSIDIDFASTPLSSVLPFIGDSAGIQIYVDPKSLEDTGVSIDTQVTLSLKETPAEVVLRSLLTDLNLVAVVENGMVVILSESAAEERLFTRIFDVRSLATRGITSTQLEDALTHETSGKWKSTGAGAGSYATVASTLLVVRQTRDVHRDIEALLKTLDTVLENGTGDAKPQAVISQ